MKEEIQALRRLLRLHSRPCSNVGKWQRAPGIHVGTKEALFSEGGIQLIGGLVCRALLALDPRVAGIAGDGIGGTAMAIAAAASAQGAGRPLVPLHVRARSDVTRSKLLIEGSASLPKGARVGVVDDTVDTTRSVARVIRLLREHGYVVSAGVFLVARRADALDKLRMLEIHATCLLTLSDLHPGTSQE